MTLLQRAKAFRIERIGKDDIDPEELDLCLAFLRGEITKAQVFAVYGNASSATNWRWWVGRVIASACEKGPS